MTPETYRLLDAIADSFNPVLAVLAIVFPLFLRPRSRRSVLTYYLCAAAALGFVYLLRALDARHGLWAALGLDYSTHTAFAASLVTSMAASRRTWLPALATALLLYFVLALVMGYHGVLDVLTSSLPAALVAAAAHRVAARLDPALRDRPPPVD